MLISPTLYVVSMLLVPRHNKTNHIWLEMVWSEMWGSQNQPYVVENGLVGNVKMSSFD